MLNRTFTLLAAICLMVGKVSAADPSFVGKWKLNAAKSDIAGFQWRIEDAGNHVFKLFLGDEVEVLNFDGKEYPTKFGAMRTSTELGPNHWKVVYTRESKVTSTDEYTVSADGQEEHYINAGTKPDGTSYRNDLKSKRVAGTTGQVGTWETTTVDPSFYPDIVIESAEGGSLAWVTPSWQERRSLKFDGKDYPDEGPRVAPGATTASKRLDEHTIELTDKRKDKLIDTQRLELSADGKTLTATVTSPGLNKKEVDVYERQ